MNRTGHASSFLLIAFVTAPPVYGHAVVECDAGNIILAEHGARETEVECTRTCNELVAVLPAEKL